VNEDIVKDSSAGRQFTEADYQCSLPRRPCSPLESNDDDNADSNDDGDDTVSCLTAHLMQGNDAGQPPQGNDYQDVLVSLRSGIRQVQVMQCTADCMNMHWTKCSPQRCSGLDW